jgi:uncharacterized protein YbaP (TraB family)
VIRTLLAVLGALALAGCGRADKTPEMPLPKPALWTITAPDGKPAGWLFGTIHALPDGVKWRTPAIEDAIAGSDLLVVEVKDLEDSAKLSAAFTRLSHTPDLPPLGDRIVPRLKGKLQAMLKQGGYREADFKAVETWAAALMLSQVGQDGQNENGVDRALIDAFHGRNIEELEGIDGQFTIFDRLPEQDQQDLLGAVVEEDTMDAAESARLAKLWLAGDMKAIEAEGDEGMLQDPELKAALLTDRNREWAGRIVALLKTGKRPLIAVGAAHLAPPAGLPELLAARGYTIARVAQ